PSIFSVVPESSSVFYIPSQRVLDICEVIYNNVLYHLPFLLSCDKNLVSLFFSLNAPAIL
ncbi:MAG: hypothetical protein K2O98_07125, partial [Lachnospiraceae bacterium]|nr:hypothetical protein [Lachnospiraceae bacterium]